MHGGSSRKKRNLPDDVSGGDEQIFKKHRQLDAEFTNCDQFSIERHRDSTDASFHTGRTYAGDPMVDSLALGSGGSTPYPTGENYYAGISNSIVGGTNNVNYMLSGHAQITYPHSPQGVPECLKQAIAPAAFHNSLARDDPPRCHPKTRVAIQENIMKWIQSLDKTTKEFSMMWLYGPAGSGKTAIAQTLAEQLQEQKMLLASYFFARLDPSRNHSRSLIATIAYQIILRIPLKARQQIWLIISQDQYITNRNLKAQIRSLIVDPLQYLIRNKYFEKDPQVVIIDGLDECVNREEQIDVLRSVSAALQEYNLPIRLLIASRPEIEIRNAFNMGPLKAISTRLALENDYRADADIYRFLSDELEEIKQTHNMAKELPTEWPTCEMVRHLVEKSSGHFIYASTVVKFIKSPRHRPDERLDVVLGLCPPGKDLPFLELDALYRRIFSNVKDWGKTSLLLSFCILRTDSSRFSVATIEALLGLRPGDCQLLLCDLVSIVGLDARSSRSSTEIGADSPISSLTLRFLHASIQDFLLDKVRSKEFYINPDFEHVRLTRQLFHSFQNGSPLQWKAARRDYVDLSILKPHIQRDFNLPELEEQISSFDVLRFFDHQFPSEVAYSIPEYLSIIGILPLPNAEMTYHTKRGAFFKYVKAQLATYYDLPCFDFLLLCFYEGLDDILIEEFNLQISDIFPSFLTHDSCRKNRNQQITGNLGSLLVITASPFWAG